MRYNKLMLFAAAITVSVVPLSSFALYKSMGLKEAMLKKIVSVDASSNGGYNGKCLNLEISNLTADDIALSVDPGLIFTPGDTNFQNLVAMGGELIQLEPYNCGKMKVEAHCGKSYAHSPIGGLTYNYWKQGDSAMVNTLAFMQHGNFSDHLEQTAVWTFTNHHCLSTVFQPDENEKSKELINFIAAQRHMPVPKYYTYYELNNTPGSAVMMEGSGKNYVEIAWKNGTGFGNMYVNVYTEKGDLYKTITGDEVCDKYGHLVTVKFDPAADKPGRYFVILEDDFNNKWVQKEVVVGTDWCNYTAMN